MRAFLGERLLTVAQSLGLDDRVLDQHCAPPIRSSGISRSTVVIATVVYGFLSCSIFIASFACASVFATLTALVTEMLHSFKSAITAPSA